MSPAADNHVSWLIVENRIVGQTRGLRNRRFLAAVPTAQVQQMETT